MKSHYHTDYEGDLNRVNVELNEKSIRLRDFSASTGYEDGIRFREYLENRIVALTNLKDQIEMILKLGG